MIRYALGPHPIAFVGDLVELLEAPFPLEEDLVNPGLYIMDFPFEEE